MAQRTMPTRTRATKRDLLRFVRGAIDRGDIPAESEQEAIASLGALVKRYSLTRRDLLRTSAATAGVTLVATDLASRLGVGASTAEATTILAAPPTFSASALRREDMLALRFDFYNLIRDKDDLVRQNAAQPAYIVVTPGYGSDYVPQNIAEEAYLEESQALTPRPKEPPDATSGVPAQPPDQQPKEPGKVKALLAGPSRLAFRVPNAILSIPFKLNALLDFAQLQLSVAPAALPRLDPSATLPSIPPIREPLETETNLEMPWHLVLSPHQDATFANADMPVTRNGRVELWHTRLAVRKTGPDGRPYADETDAANRTVRAIWTNGFDVTAPPDNAALGPFRMSLKPLDRWQIVELSSDFKFRVSGHMDRPQPIDVENLMLSALGGWQKTRGVWVEPPTDFNLGEWKHIATMARDHYVKVVYLGWLLPYGHPAALVKVTERKLQQINASAPDRAAYLRQRFFVVVRKPVMEYDGLAPQPQSGRGIPFKSVEVKTTITPTLNNPADPQWAFDGKGDLAFVPVVNNVPFQFSLRATDHDGQTSEFTLPLVFVSYPLAGNLTSAEIGNIVDHYAAADPTAYCPKFEAKYKKSTLGGQKIGLGKSTPTDTLPPTGKPGDTAVEIKTMSFSAKRPLASPAVPDGHAPFYPTWTEADIRLNGVEQVSGNSFAKVTIAPHDTFLDKGFTQADNPGAVFVKMLGTAPGVKFADEAKPAVDRAGGLVNMDMSIGGLSRSLGPVGGSVSTVPQQFDPTKFFPDAKILGGIKLSDIIAAIGFGDLAKVPKMVTNTIYPGGDTARPPEAVETTVNFIPDLVADPLGIFDPTTDGATMTIDAKFRAPIDPPGPPTYEIVGDLRNFRVTLIGKNLGLAAFLELAFNQLKFTTKNGSKPNVDVDIREVNFVGVLAFVNALKDFMKLGSTGPSIDIQPTQVTAGFSIPIPTVGVGVLTIQNIAFGAGLTIPFTGKPARVRFNFSEREDPFLVTVLGLGGGGFFAIALGLDGMEMFEMSIEVGASVALNLGVASGEVHALAGFYYKMERKTQATDPKEYDQIDLEAYIRLGGSVNVLGIASVSVEFYLGLKYQDPPNELWGQASLTVEVEVLCFSKSFSFSVERRIAGGGDSSYAPGAMIAAASGGSHVAALPAKNRALFNFTDLMSKDEWADYAAAFATS